MQYILSQSLLRHSYQNKITAQLNVSRWGITRQPGVINITYTATHHNEQLTLYVINYATYAYKVTPLDNNT